MYQYLILGVLYLVQHVDTVCMFEKYYSKKVSGQTILTSRLVSGSAECQRVCWNKVGCTGANLYYSESKGMVCEMLTSTGDITLSSPDLGDDVNGMVLVRKEEIGSVHVYLRLMYNLRPLSQLLGQRKTYTCTGITFQYN